MYAESVMLITAIIVLVIFIINTVLGYSFFGALGKVAKKSAQVLIPIAAEEVGRRMGNSVLGGLSSLGLLPPNTTVPKLF